MSAVRTTESAPTALTLEVRTILSKLPSLRDSKLDLVANYVLGFHATSDGMATEAFVVLKLRGERTPRVATGRASPLADKNRKTIPRRIGIKVLEADPALDGPWLEVFGGDASFELVHARMEERARVERPSSPKREGSPRRNGSSPRRSPRPTGKRAPIKPPASTASAPADLRKRLRPVFDKFDADGSGAISSAEMEAVCHAMGFDFTPAQIRRMIAAGDPDRSGSIDFDEFVVLMEKQMAEGTAGGLGSLFASAGSFFGFLNPLSWLGGPPAQPPAAITAATPLPAEPASREGREGQRSPVRAYGGGMWKFRREPISTDLTSPTLLRGMPPRAMAQSPPPSPATPLPSYMAPKRPTSAERERVRAEAARGSPHRTPKRASSKGAPAGRKVTGATELTSGTPPASAAIVPAAEATEASGVSGAGGTDAEEASMWDALEGDEPDSQEDGPHGSGDDEPRRARMAVRGGRNVRSASEGETAGA